MANAQTPQDDRPAPEGGNGCSYWHPRDPLRPDGAVRIGVVDHLGKAWEPVMLYTQAAEEIRGLWAMLDKITAFLGRSSALPGPSWDSAAQALATELSAMKAKLIERGGTLGGKGAAGLQGRAASGV